MTQARVLRAAAVTPVLGVAAAACTNEPTPSSTSALPTPVSTTPPPTAVPPTTLAPSPSDSPSSATPPPTVLTEADSGLTVTLAVGATVPLRLDSRLQWETPTVDGPGVTLVPVAYKSDPGYREWEIRAERPGEVVVRTTGPGPSGPRELRITVRVIG
ncbi:protease inhibitor I42 family protein [Streptomyces sp. NPDC059909]|uniref:protease inhibitor I42 family protein n=1 Tax=Streptomyces sp. NPDC059909 TaxID=3346998 RepID=UPI003669A7B7